MNLVEQIKKIGPDALKPIYLDYKPTFIKSMLRYTKDLDLRIDAFHEAMVSFYEYCLEGKYDENKSSPQTLIYLMGRAYLLNRLKKENKITAREEDGLEYLQKGINLHFDMTLDSYEAQIHQALQNLGEKCRELIHLFYYHNYSIDAIMHRLNYKNENVVSSHKARCISQLKQIMQSNKNATN
ncbi:MAG: sigma-70 family RNA polymerase sigma factor [Saprospiraceae bacterium]|nr:sigma-70 family RNA polymerase sigma factor [Saprospiraceae bacterium]